MGDTSPQQLKRALGLWDLVGFGIASIMGSGGFNLISEGVVQGGRWFPAAIALIATLFQGASKAYDEAYKVFKSNTAESDVVQQQFGSTASKLTGLSILGFNIFSVSTILVFAAKNLFPAGKWHGQIGIALLILSAMFGFSLKGIELDKQVIGFFAACIVGLLAFASAIGLVEGFGPNGTPPDAWPAALDKTPSFLKSVLFFYFILSGFDDLMKFTQESKDPDKDIPRSFYLSNGISTVLTTGVAYAFVHVLTLRRGSTTIPTKNAIGMILESALGPPTGTAIYWLGIFLMIVTAFVSFLAVTRYIYSLADKVDSYSTEDEKAGPFNRFLHWLQDLNAAAVPWRAVLLTFSLTSLGILMNHTETLVKISDFFLTLTMFSVTSAVTKMRLSKGEAPWIEGATATGFLGLLSTWLLPS
jgi:basic amino acid/polyamine antiporter, APA family